MNKVLVIAGFHRSGTSLTAQYLRNCGLHIGDVLMGANPSNPLGHFEDLDFLRLHNNILLENGVNWQISEPIPFRIEPERWTEMHQLVLNRNRAHQAWGFKDPRVCLFLQHWRHVYPATKTLIVYRHPGECVHSLL